MNASSQPPAGPRLVIVGAGRMGGAVLQGALGAGVITKDEVAIFHPNPRRLAELTERHGVPASTTPASTTPSTCCWR